MHRVVIENVPDDRAWLIEAFAEFIRGYPSPPERPRLVHQVAPALFGVFPTLRDVPDAELDAMKHAWDEGASRQANLMDEPRPS